MLSKMVASAFLCLVKVLVGIEGADLRLDDGDGNVRAVVRDTLVACKQVCLNEACLDGAFACLQAVDMVALCLRDQLVNDLLQRLNMLCQGAVVGSKCLDCKLQNLGNGFLQGIQFSRCFGGEGDLLVVDLFCALLQLNCVVTQTLKVTDGVQELGNLA